MNIISSLIDRLSIEIASVLSCDLFLFLFLFFLFFFFLFLIKEREREAAAPRVGTAGVEAKEEGCADGWCMEPRRR